MGLIDKELTEYLKSVQPPFPGVLGEIHRDALQEGFPVIPPETARLLAVLVTMAKPLRVLEIGCAVGFSASLMASHMPPGGTVTTIDRYEYMTARARVNINKMNLSERITILEGDAADILPSLAEPFDFIFLDAAKGQYGRFMPDCLRLLRTGGLLVADDVLQEGSLAGDRLDTPRRQRTTYTRMNDFLHVLSHTDGLQTSVIPIGDGVAVAYKLADEVTWKGAANDE